MYYSTISKSYDELYKQEQLAKLEFIKNKINIIPPLLDIGCGTGLALAYFKQGVGIDSSFEMLKLGNGNLIQANAEFLPFRDKSFNTIISLTSIQNFDNIEKAVKEIFRVSINNNIIISIMKQSSELEQLRNLLKNFKELEQEKDIFFINQTF